MMRKSLFRCMGILFILQCATGIAWCLDPAQAPKSGSSVYEYDEKDPPAVFFFPPEKARWDGSRVTIREWYMLTETQKEKFISEYLEEIRKSYRSPIDVVGLDYLRALNMFSYFANEKKAASPTTKVIDSLLAGQGKVAVPDIPTVTATPEEGSHAAPAAVRTLSTTKIVTRVDDTISIALESNPTTGYAWESKEPFRKDILELVGKEYDADTPGLIGGGGREVWTFKAIGEGVTAVTLVYRRQWEKDVAPAKESRFVIAILGRSDDRTGTE